MKIARHIHYRYLTDADFFNLNKPRGTEDSGGGQTYLDFPVRKVPLKSWQRFFSIITHVKPSRVARGPAWDFPVYSIGLPARSEGQQVRIYQRRPTSISVAAQSLNRRGSNRVHGWHPRNGFPQPVNPNDRHGTVPEGLCVYLVSTGEGEVWAGWFQQGANLGADEAARLLIEPMLSRTNTVGSSGSISLDGVDLFLREDNLAQPFFVQAAGNSPPKRPTSTEPAIMPQPRIPSVAVRSEQDVLDGLFREDEDPKDERPETRERIQRIRVRNLRAVRSLKELYRNRCQISGDRFSFKKRNGETYSEVHHLIPLGDGGADNPLNMIVVNPLIHRMLHYCEVIGLDLSRIRVDSKGRSTLEIWINGAPYRITWHKGHGERILAAK